MIHQIPALIILVPFIAALLIGIVGKFSPKSCYFLAMAAMSISLVFAVILAREVYLGSMIQYKLGGWDPPFGIEYRVDYLNVLVLGLIFFVSFLNLVSNYQTIRIEFPDKEWAFLSVYCLFVVGLAGIVITADAFNLYVLLEISSLTGYALVGMGKRNASLSGLNYLLVGTVGASLYLLGIGYLYLMTGSLNMNDLLSLLPELYESKVLVVAYLLCLTGLLIKMAYFPLHIWLPNAYSQASTSALGLLAPLTTKIMIYTMVRISISLFSFEFTEKYLNIDEILVWLSSIGIVVASVIAISQKSITRIVVYIIVAEIGYMVGGFWLGDINGYIGSILHIFNDGLMTLAVVLVIANIRYKLQTDNFENLNGLSKKMPITLFVFIICALAFIGVPPTCGFFSKWFLILGAIKSGHYVFMFALIFSSLINVILFFKIIEYCFFQKDTDESKGAADQPIKPAFAEAPGNMLAGVLVSGFSLIIAGLLTRPIVIHYIEKALI